MSNKAVAAGVLMLATITSAVDIPIEDFSTGPNLTWESKNDPVMGGESTGAVMVQDGMGKFKGEVVNVPFLSAPGFIKMQTTGGDYPDVSSCKGIEFVARSNKPYAGYRFSFGSASAPGSRYARGFHANFQIGSAFQSVTIPFTSFSDNWDGATGEIVVECKDDVNFCPDAMTLSNMGTMSFWGEGVNGVVDLEVKSVGAYECSELPLSKSLSSDVLLIEDFKPKKMNWYAKNDPVMGGQSSATVLVEDGVAKFSGKVVDVPKLKAPGFVTMESMGGPYPDIHCCKGLDFVARAKTDYAGYRVSFGKGHAEGGRYAFGFKAPFKVGTDFGSVKIPFSDFSDNWDDATGDIKIKCEVDKTFCPDIETLKDMGTMAFWGEGVDGVIDLEVRTVSAYECTGTCGGYSSRNQGGGGNGGFQGGGNFGGSRGGKQPMPASVQGNAAKDIQDTIAVPLAVTAILASLISFFCVFQMRSNAKSAEKVVLVADKAVELD